MCKVIYLKDHRLCKIAKKNEIAQQLAVCDDAMRQFALFKNSGPMLRALDHIMKISEELYEDIKRL